MRIVTMTVGIDGYRRLEGRASVNRRSYADEAITWVDRTGGGLIVFPSGYLRARDAAEAAVIARDIAVAHRTADVAVVMGIDACPPSKASKASRDAEVASASLPFFVAAWTAGSIRVVVRRQRSTTGKNYKLMPGRPKTLAAHGVTFGGQSVEILSCGEGFNQYLRDEIAKRDPAPTALVLPAHWAHGLRHWQALKYSSETLGLPAFCSVHTTNGNGLKQAWVPPGRNIGTGRSVHQVGSEPRLELAEWHL